MDSIDKLDLFQSLKDEESTEGTSLKSISESEDHKDEELKFEPHTSTNSNRRSLESDQDDDPAAVEKKIKLDKQNRKEIEEEEREKML